MQCGHRGTFARAPRAGRIRCVFGTTDTLSLSMQPPPGVFSPFRGVLQAKGSDADEISQRTRRPLIL